MRISDWSSDVCSSDLDADHPGRPVLSAVDAADRRDRALDRHSSRRFAVRAGARGGRRAARLADHELGDHRGGAVLPAFGHYGLLTRPGPAARGGTGTTLYSPPPTSPRSTPPCLVQTRSTRRAEG